MAIEMIVGFCFVVAMWKYGRQVTWWQAIRGIVLTVYCCLRYPFRSNYICLISGKIVDYSANTSETV